MAEALLVKPDGHHETVYSKGRHWVLDEMQKHVGGFIELASAKEPGWTLVINEEGKLKGLPVNEYATALYSGGDWDPIVGDALYMLERMID